ncbi:P-loop containing nucleoside triphosphate hydrolase protein [Polychytrium aggregatum]|uniref:P-loop containing nucleoside triphosphate hydrolase protein n=1 Tax=Polychytrium aggregatum TaxID=110093 RepID=UPI0022FE54D3|nr:P-loop containing nucleoside triphosphate hydrolase protein [Polychytrium aggregatum]KAI9206778.1 P-loop containing nucleoside triphosphate hydrolase protein [Polychytrium aggregatum]
MRPIAVTPLETVQIPNSCERCPCPLSTESLSSDTAVCVSPHGPLAQPLQPSKERSASLFALLTFSWLGDLIYLGNQRQLAPGDVWDLDPSDKTETVYKIYERVKPKYRTLWIRLFMSTWKTITAQFMISSVSSLLSFASPLFLNAILNWMQCPHANSYTAWGYLLGLFSCSIIQAMLNGQMYFNGRRTGTRLRAILIREIYEKSLRRPATVGQSSQGTGDGKSEPGQQDASLGKIVTLMSSDTETIRNMVCYIHVLLETPLRLLLSIGLMVYFIGYSALVGLAAILICVPITSWLGSCINRQQRRAMEKTDKRVTATNEALQGIRIIKYFAWEPHFIKQINVDRTEELQCRLHVRLLHMAFSTISESGGLFCAFGSFVTFVLTGNVLDAATAFTTLSICQQVTWALSRLPNEVMWILRAMVSLERIEKFLGEEELQKFAEKDIPSRSEMDHRFKPNGFDQATYIYYGSGDSSVRSSKASLQLSSSIVQLENPGQEESSAFTLNNLNLDIPLGKLTVVCGPTGAGKSSLILALVGEMRRIGGHCYFPSRPNRSSGSIVAGEVAYVAQTAWLMNATIRDNILFGEDYDEDRYHRVVFASALVRDFQNLEGGDLTEIGEKGVNLSGGQKQRISLARALYSRAPFVLLDDPLSAVDAPTARHLLHHGILGFLKNRTCVLVSHAVGLVAPHANHIVVMRNGAIACQGTAAEVLRSPESEGILDDQILAVRPSEVENATSLQVPNHEEIKKLLSEARGKTLVHEEARVKGAVEWAVYSRFLKACGGIFFAFCFVFLFVIMMSAGFANSWWLKKWTDASSGNGNSTICPVANASLIAAGGPLAQHSTFPSFRIVAPPIHSPYYYVTVYALIGLSVILSTNLHTLVQVMGSYSASKALHAQLLKAVLGAPLRFFEITPLGRILNRFSKDMGHVDDEVMWSVGFFSTWLFRGASVLIIVAYITPPFILLIVPVALIYMYVAKLYLTCSRELKRLESVSRSPIYSQFSETIAGTSTIRAYGAESRLLLESSERVDENHRSFFYMWAANRWLCMRTDIIAALVVFCAGAAVVSGQVSAGWAGVSLTYAMSFTDALLWLVRSHADMEMNLTSVERIDEYVNIQPEADESAVTVKAPVGWPSAGRIDVSHLFMRYAADQPNVLKDMSFSVKAGERIGVVGRTGAGKSTLSLAFFRILPIHQGRIIIDDIDISQISLHDLRSNITIIPQDPVLFSGTIRSNLDALGEHDDADLWQVLKRVHFLDTLQEFKKRSPRTSFGTVVVEDAMDTISPMGGSAVLSQESETKSFTLESPVGENGQNYSHGQRQLLCLARALLRNSKIIFLDEATASVDNDTDARIQVTIREELAGATVLCIAHRLRTIVDYDRVMVLDKGTIVEYDTPLNLMQRKDGAFHRMCQDSNEFEELEQIATAASRSRSRK